MQRLRDQTAYDQILGQHESKCKFSKLHYLLIATQFNKITQVKDLRQCPYRLVLSKWQVTVKFGVF